MGWSGAFLKVLKDNDVRLVTYVPDNVLTPLLNGVTSDNYFRSVCTTREDEAVGVVAGAWMGGMKSVVMMQTSGFALIANALASLTVPSQIPTVMVISERGTMGEFNVGQHLVARTMRPVLESLGIAHHTLDDEATMPFIVDRSIKQAFMTQASVAFILSPLLTGGNPAGIANSHWVRDEDHFEQLTTRRVTDDGPLFVAVKIDDKPGPIQTPRDPALIRNRFMKGLGVGKAGALD